MTGCAGQNWFVYVYNWNAACNCGVVCGALNLLEDRNDRAVFAEAAERSTRNYLKGLSPDGCCLEGTGYWNYGFSRYLYLGLALREATGGLVDLFADPLTRKSVVDYAFFGKIHQDSGLPFSDGTGVIDPYVLAVARRVWPDVASSKTLKVDVLRAKDCVFNLMAFGPPLPDVKPTMDVLPIRTVFPDAQVFIFRPDPDADPPRHELAFTIKGGHNGEPHNHNDVGSYLISLDRKPVCGDPMGVTYSRQVWGNLRYTFPTINSYGHPVPRPAETLQSDGKLFSARVVSSEYSPSHEVVSLDLSGAYKLGDVLKKLVRTVDFDRGKQCVTLTDSVEFSSPQHFETPIVTYADVIYDYEKQFLTLEVDKDTKMGVTIEVKGGDWHWSNDVLANQCRKSPKRLAVALDKPVLSAEVSICYKVE